MGDLKTLGRDEKMHVFVHEGPGIYRHYSYDRWERLPALTSPVEERIYTYDEAKAWVDSQMMDEKPISKEEVDTFKRGWWGAYDGKASVEPDYPTKTDRVIKQFTCERCGIEVYGTPMKYGFHEQLCKMCWKKLGGDT